jgi:hypothetical protein
MQGPGMGRQPAMGGVQGGGAMGGGNPNAQRRR